MQGLHVPVECGVSSHLGQGAFPYFAWRKWPVPTPDFHPSSVIELGSPASFSHPKLLCILKSIRTFWFFRGHFDTVCDIPKPWRKYPDFRTEGEEC